MITVDEHMNITLTKGDSAVLALALKDGEGNDYDYSGDVVKFALKRIPQDNAVLLEKTVDENGNIVFTPEDTNSLEGYGDFIYAIKLYHTVEAEVETNEENVGENVEETVADDEEPVVDVYTPIVARFSLGYNII